MQRAMVIDDSRAIRMILGRTLANLGFEVSAAKNGREGLEALEQNSDRVSVILVDWNMPEMTGIEFVRAVRSRAAYRDITLMMVTSETQPEQIMEALQAGADEYVMKPFTEQIIADKLRLLGKSIPAESAIST